MPDSIAQNNAIYNYKVNISNNYSILWFRRISAFQHHQTRSIRGYDQEGEITPSHFLNDHSDQAGLLSARKNGHEKKHPGFLQDASDVFYSVITVLPSSDQPSVWTDPFQRR